MSEDVYIAVILTSYRSLKQTSKMQF